MSRFHEATAARGAEVWAAAAAVRRTQPHQTVGAALIKRLCGSCVSADACVGLEFALVCSRVQTPHIDTDDFDAHAAMRFNAEFYLLKATTKNLVVSACVLTQRHALSYRRWRVSDSAAGTPPRPLCHTAACGARHTGEKRFPPVT